MKHHIKYSHNTFLSQTRDTCEKAVALIRFHIAMLKVYHDMYPDDEDYAKMYNRTLPIAEDVEQKHAVITTYLYKQVSQSGAVKLNMKKLKGKKGFARDWFTRTAAIYAFSDPGRMTTMWAKGLKPYNTTVLKATTTLAALSKAIGDDTNPLMIAIKVEVDAFYLLLNPSKEMQRADMAAYEFHFNEFKKTCVQAMTMEYRNSGLLMDKFPDNEDGIQDAFHDLEVLLDKQQKLWNITLHPHQVKDIGTRTQEAESKFTAKATGGNAKLYLASVPGKTDSEPIELTDGIPFKFVAADFVVSDFALHRHITVVSDAEIPIKFRLKLG